MRVCRWVLFSFVCLLYFSFSQVIDVGARSAYEGPRDKGVPGPEGVLVVDGSNVHNVGELWMHIGNWGLFGSMPNATLPFSFAPSAQWPAGSGVEYLWGAGIWVGALKGGIPAVSTSLYQTEFRPTQDPVDIIYRSYQGAPGGNRYPNPNADDDHDGKIDEDWLNGRDDDGDGKIDEDFAAISDQMFSCWYTDDQPAAIQQFPEHNPLNLLVRQESYEWESNGFDDFVAASFQITNIGDELLEDVYIGVFADFDCGPRTRPNYWEDDAVGFLSTSIPPQGPDLDKLEIAYGYDADGDGGLTPGYLGVLLLDHTTDPTGETAPTEVKVVTYANFSGAQPYSEGGDPTNDFERYELLSSGYQERPPVVPRDIRSLMAVGPFPTLAPGQTVMFRIAWVAGLGFQGMMENAAAAMRLYKNNWYTGEEVIHAKLDIQPGMCPNRLVVTPPDRDAVRDRNDDSMAGGVLHAALLGRRGFRVEDVDLRSLRLEGVAPVKKPVLRDVGTEPMRERACVCPGTDPDGFMDLVLKFRKRDVVAALLPVIDGEERIVTLTGTMMDGRPLRAVDCVLISMAGKSDERGPDCDCVALRSVTPNPFNPVTRISYYLPEEAYVTVAVFDVSGRFVDRLVSRMEDAGEHTVEWNAARVPSGIYFGRLEAGGAVDTRKLIVIK